MKIIDINVNVENLEECKNELIELILMAEKNLQIGLDESNFSKGDGETVIIYIDGQIPYFIVNGDIPIMIEFLVEESGLTQTNFTLSYDKCDRDLTVFLAGKDYGK